MKKYTKYLLYNSRNLLTNCNFFRKLISLRLHLKPNKIGCPESGEICHQGRGAPAATLITGIACGLRKILCGSSVHTHSRGV